MGKRTGLIGGDADGTRHYTRAFGGFARPRSRVQRRAAPTLRARVSRAEASHSDRPDTLAPSESGLILPVRNADTSCRKCFVECSSVARWLAPAGSSLRPTGYSPSSLGRSVSRSVLLATSVQTFFTHAVLERDLSDDFLALTVLASQLFDFVTGGFPDRMSRQLFLPRLEKVLAPSVVEVGGDAFSPTQIRDAPGRGAALLRSVSSQLQRKCTDRRGDTRIDSVRGRTAQRLVAGSPCGWIRRAGRRADRRGRWLR